MSIVTDSGVTVNTGVLDAIDDAYSQEVHTKDIFREPILDLASTAIVDYRLAVLKANQIRYANALRSVRMRAARSKQSETNAYLMKNDAVVVTQDGSGWVQTQ